MKYNKNYFYLFIPFLDQPTGQTRGWIFTHDSDSSKDVKSRKDVPFGGLNYAAPNFVGISPKN